MVAFFLAHYEKIILACLLVVLAVLLIWQVNFLQAVQSQKVDDIINKADPLSDQSRNDFSEDKYKDDVIFASNVIWHQRPKINSLQDPRPDLFSCFNLSVCPFCFNLINSELFPELGSKDVHECPIKDCKHKILARQNKVEHKPEDDIQLTQVVTDDENQNMVSDEWEKANNVYSADPNAIDGDPDGDGFSSYAEYVLKTDPLDPKSHPEYIGYMTVRDLTRTPIANFRFTNLAAVNPDEPEKTEFTIQYRERSWNEPRKRAKHLNEPISHGDFTIRITKVEFDDPQRPGPGTVIYIKRDGYEENIKCEMNKTVYDPVETVVMRNLVTSPKKDIRCQVGKSFKLGNAKTGEEVYLVESATKRSAVVVGKDGRKIELKAYNRDQQIVPPREKLKAPEPGIEPEPMSEFPTYPESKDSRKPPRPAGKKGK